MKLTTLYKRATTGKITEWTIEVEGNKFRTITGFTDGKKTTSAWTECFGKNEGKKNGTTPEQQALAEATATHRKRIELGSFENINDIDNEIFYEPMLAHKLEDHITKLKYPVFSQPKLDGIRCIVKADGMWTRKGKKIISAPHIYNDLKPLFDKDPDLIFDGELYCDRLSNDFNKIISLVRKAKPLAEDIAESKATIKYHIYDLPSHMGTFKERSFTLSNLDLSKSCIIVDTFVLFSEREMVEQYAKYMEQGYEGQMIRLDLPYENKRSKSLLKDKRFLDAEFTILGVEEGDGNMAGKVGKLNFEINGKPFDAAVNGDWEYLAKLLKAKDLIGKQATVKYFQLTPDGIPRFPKVIAIRDYE
jgi:DNA ligase-1